MAWTKKTVNGFVVATETVTLGTTGTVYTSEIDFLKQGSNNNKYISILGSASAVSGTNVDVSVYAVHASAGTKFQLLDAPVADLTNAAKTAGGRVDINAYPAPYYYLGFLVDADESANTVTTTIVFSD